eukprot:NODE_75_length_23955_cov_0.435069.p7 type:complete len:344 gc:universal NODE_75_length_23955_cov_0.435069:16626-17657(+)
MQLYLFVLLAIVSASDPQPWFKQTVAFSNKELTALNSVQEEVRNELIENLKKHSTPRTEAEKKGLAKAIENIKGLDSVALLNEAKIVLEDTELLAHLQKTTDANQIYLTNQLKYQNAFKAYEDKLRTIAEIAETSDADLMELEKKAGEKNLAKFTEANIAFETEVNTIYKDIAKTADDETIKLLKSHPGVADLVGLEADEAQKLKNLKTLEARFKANQLTQEQAAQVKSFLEADLSQRKSYALLFEEVGNGFKKGTQAAENVLTKGTQGKFASAIERNKFGALAAAAILGAGIGAVAMSGKRDTPYGILSNGQPAGADKSRVEQQSGQSGQQPSTNQSVPPAQ